MALKVPEEGRQVLEQASKKMKINLKERGFEAKFAIPENWHITLHFVGEVADEQIIEIQKAMDAVAARTAPFILEIHGIGAFDSLEHARVLWAGVRRTAELLTLQKEVRSQLGLPPDERDFVPHLTIARLRNHVHLLSYVSPFLKKDFMQGQASEIVLYHSVLQGRFPKYVPLYTAKFGS